ncbi:MFS transporter [Spongiactinospora rosea]|uniref:MFS transporter n=1 Tax=Spongiactinospora rosea TaxID=2248750 RepID=A0A366LVN6_9ACTN|nr:MFS transporter [Spongiactinospora rosea]RBQ18015.1 MFS transporter [Spongiactinospora rosea]
MTVDTRTRMTGRERMILVILLGAQFMLAADFSIFTVALPAIGGAVGLDLAALQWVATAYALPAAGLTLLFGRVADLYGRRRMLLTGMAILAVSSAAGGLSGDPVALLAARVAQGLATAITMPAALSLITTSFAEGPLRERALGLSGALMATGFTAGSLLGGVLTGALSWRWAFLINVPVALAVLAAAPGLLPRGRGTAGGALDLPGALAVTGGMVALVYGVTTEPPALLLAGVLLGAFLWIERRSPRPLVPAGMLRRPTVKWGNLGGLATVGMATATTFLMTIYLQGVLGYSATVTGLALGIPGLAAFAGSVAAPALIRRCGSHAVLSGGLAVQGAMTALLLFTGTGRGAIGLVIIVVGACFAGNMAAVVAFTVTATSRIPDHEQGLATGIATMTQQVAMTLGIPVISAVVAAATGPSAQAVLSGIHAGLLANAAIPLAAAALIAFFLSYRNAE